ncbi:MAG: zinc-binding dehydrogenase [Acidimicrobiales bacterium]
MRAVQLTAFGWPPSVGVREVPDPEPGFGEVVVAVEAAALNRRDLWVIRYDGYCELPVTLGSDASGRVIAVGDGVESRAVGDEVVIDPTLGWGDREDWPGPAFDILGAPTPGTLADRVVVPAANAHPKPAHLGWAEAAALSLGGLTAWRAVHTCAQAGPGRSILVTGAGGGVASFAVQIAVALGARAYVTSGDPGKIVQAVALGAAGGVSYRDAAWPEMLLELAGDPLDAVVDSYGGPAWPAALRVLRPGGRMVSFGDTGGSTATIAVDEIYWQWRSILGTSMGSPREYQQLLAHVERATWRPVINRRYPLEAAADALAAMEEPTRFGKIVVDVGGAP